MRMAPLALGRLVSRAVFEYDCCGGGARLTSGGGWLGEFGATISTEARLGRVFAGALWAAGNERNAAPNAALGTRSILEIAA
jgi:hypothetical protein